MKVIAESMNQAPQSYRAGEPTPRILSILVVLGHTTLVVTLMSWFLMYLFFGQPYQQTWWIILTALFLGRGAAVGSGLGIHFNPWYLYFIAVMSEVFLVFYVYPIFVRNYRHLTHVPHIGRHLDNLHTAALHYKTRVAPYGIAGLLVFVVFPFWSTGPLVGSILGFLIGLPVRATLLTVNLGNIVAAALWVYAYDSLHDWNRGAALLLLAVFLAFAIGGILFAQFQHKRRTNAIASDHESEETDHEE